MRLKGSGLSGANIIFSRKFRPHNDRHGFNATLAYYDYGKEQTTVFLPGFAACYGIKNSYGLQRKVINTFSHEFIHGLIMKILESDKFTGEMSEHWPHLNGLDDDYRRMVEEAMRNKKK